MSEKPSMFRIVALRAFGGMSAVLAALCLLVAVLAAIVWAKGGADANGMPALAGIFLVGFLVCTVGYFLLRRRSERVEAAALADQPNGRAGNVGSD